MTYIHYGHVGKRKAPDQGIAAVMEVLYDLETALENITAIIEDFAEASTAETLLNIILSGSRPDESSVNNTLDLIEDGMFAFKAKLPQKFL